VNNQTLFELMNSSLSTGVPLPSSINDSFNRCVGPIRDLFIGKEGEAVKIISDFCALFVRSAR